MILTSIMRIILTRSFKPFKFINRYSSIIDFKDEKSLGLYVHIPFCKNICSFCPYCKVIYDKELSEKYKNALIKEIDLVGKLLNGKKKKVTSLYFGGGTPALMIEDLGDIINALEKHFLIENGIGVELHPEDISEYNLRKLKNYGVSMISIGMQSFNEECLKSLGRENKGYLEKFKIVEKIGFDVVDVDLIFAIPNQTEETLIEDIKTAFENGATQISTYPFIDFTFANNKYKPLPESKKKVMLKKISDYCKENQLERTSVWTFAKRDTEKYSSITRDNFLGFGVSATTLLKKQFKINTFSIESYMSRINEKKLPTSLTLYFTLRQRAVYYLFWSSYSMKINIENFENYFGISLKKLYGFEFWIALLIGFVEKRENEYVLTDKGAYYYHYIEQAYTGAYIDKMWNVSRNISFPEEIILK